MISAVHEASKGKSSTTKIRKSNYDASQFDWPLAYEAEKLIQGYIAYFLERNSFAKELAARMSAETATDFFEWIDHLVLPTSEAKTLAAAGFTEDKKCAAPEGLVVMHHARATLPRVLMGKAVKGTPAVIALRPEFVADFIARNNLSAEIEGAPLSRYRRAVINKENGCTLEAVERNAYTGFLTEKFSPAKALKALEARELWTTRKRFFENDAEGFKVANKVLNQSISLVGVDVSCQMFFQAERVYWESRNRAARVQKFRQDKLGLGWGNHDHHTFRCSRRYFVDLIKFLLRLGFQKRERYYAGAEAGWGAQISEQNVTGITVFADVDLLPDETQIDFTVNRLPDAPKLSTVGLWTGLHGESMLSAGMHHLEARFDYELLRDHLKEQGVNTMNPFSNFDFLKQAFTEGERWQVCRTRAERLLKQNLITQEQFNKFMTEGALGSHLENLQRHGGFKGFNQKSVSAVISATDPRREHFQHTDS